MTRKEHIDRIDTLFDEAVVAMQDVLDHLGEIGADEGIVEAVKVTLSSMASLNNVLEQKLFMGAGEEGGGTDE